MSDDQQDQPVGPSAADPPPLGASRGIVLTPVPPGGSLLVFGLVVAVLGPLGGFLAGSMVDNPGTTDEVSPIFLYLFAGFVLGGLGLALAAWGGRRLFRHVRADQV